MRSYNGRRGRGSFRPIGIPEPWPRLPKGDLGEACFEDNDCSTDLCRDGFCCNQDCQNGACNIPGLLGECRPLLPNGEFCDDDDRACLRTFTPMAKSTETPTPVLCPGDCDDSGEVLVDEVITGVALLLDRQAKPCRAADPNNDEDVTIDEVISILEAALRGCASLRR